jgi:hypothetical protein
VVDSTYLTLRISCTEFSVGGIVVLPLRVRVGVRE